MVTWLRRRTRFHFCWRLAKDGMERCMTADCDHCYKQDLYIIPAYHLFYIIAAKAAWTWGTRQKNLKIKNLGPVVVIIVYLFCLEISSFKRLNSSRKGIWYDVVEKIIASSCRSESTRLHVRTTLLYMYTQQGRDIYLIRRLAPFPILPLSDNRSVSASRVRGTRGARALEPIKDQHLISKTPPYSNDLGS